MRYACVLWFQFLQESENILEPAWVTYFSFHADAGMQNCRSCFSLWWPMVVLWTCGFDLCFWTMVVISFSRLCNFSCELVLVNLFCRFVNLWLRSLMIVNLWLWRSMIIGLCYEFILRYGLLGCWVLILATFCNLGQPIYKPDGHPKPDGFGFGFRSEFSLVGVSVGAGLIFHPTQFCCGSGFCSTWPKPDSLPSLIHSFSTDLGVHLIAYVKSLLTSSSIVTSMLPTLITLFAKSYRWDKEWSYFRDGVEIPFNHRFFQNGLSIHIFW
jgi:hypothetical protein